MRIKWLFKKVLSTLILWFFAKKNQKVFRFGQATKFEGSVFFEKKCFHPLKRYLKQYGRAKINWPSCFYYNTSRSKLSSTTMAGLYSECFSIIYSSFKDAAGSLWAISIETTGNVICSACKIIATEGNWKLDRCNAPLCLRKSVIETSQTLKVFVSFFDKILRKKGKTETTRWIIRSKLTDQKVDVRNRHSFHQWT